MEITPKQVDKSHYGLRYIHPLRWFSYLLQIKSVVDLAQEKNKILIIGVGDGVVSDYLGKRDLLVKTLDIDNDLKPDFVGDVRRLPFKDESFDIVLCAEVLEHLPFEDFYKALSEIRRVAGQYAVISLPDKRSTLLYLKIKLPFIKERRIFIKVPNFRVHEFDGQHYWEIGKRGYGFGKIHQYIKKAGFRIIKDFTDPDSPTIHFFILEKI